MSARPRVPALPPLDRYERAQLRRELFRWGRWMERQAEHSGYPSADSFAAEVFGCGGGLNGHRVLMLDMPDSVWATNARVMRLDEPLRAAIRSIYADIVTTDGKVISWLRRAQRIQISEETLRWQHEKALRLIAGIEL